MYSSPVEALQPFNEDFRLLTLLKEVEKMVREVGVEVQRESGAEHPDGDFGIQLLAGKTGIAFHKGSIRASAALTRDVENGIKAVSAIIDTTDIVEKKKVVSANGYGDPVFRRLSAIAEIQRRDKTWLQFGLSANSKLKKQAAFTERGAKVLAQMATAEFAIESVTLYGKLRRLMDFSRDEEEGSHFWGELREDNGKEWRIRFKQSDLRVVQRLFTKQVVVAGNASYFKTRHPRVNATLITEEKPRDYVAAYNRFRKTYADVFSEDDPATLIDEAKG